MNKVFVDSRERKLERESVCVSVFLFIKMKERKEEKEGKRKEWVGGVSGFSRVITLLVLSLVAKRCR